MDTYEGVSLEVLFVERVWFRSVADAQVKERLPNPVGDIFEHVVIVDAKVQSLATMACLSCQDGVVKDGVEIRD